MSTDDPQAGNLELHERLEALRAEIAATEHRATHWEAMAEVWRLEALARESDIAKLIAEVDASLEAESVFFGSMDVETFARIKLDWAKRTINLSHGQPPALAVAGRKLLSRMPSEEMMNAAIPAMSAGNPQFVFETMWDAAP
jgi:hypothetical protein